MRGRRTGKGHKGRAAGMRGRFRASAAAALSVAPGRTLRSSHFDRQISLSPSLSRRLGSGISSTNQHQQLQGCHWDTAGLLKNSPGVRRVKIYRGRLLGAMTLSAAAVRNLHALHRRELAAQRA